MPPPLQGRREHIPSTSRPQHELEPCFNYFLLGIRLLCHSPSPATSPLLVFVLSFFCPGFAPWGWVGSIQHPHNGDRMVPSSPSPCSTACQHLCWLQSTRMLCHIAAEIQWEQGGVSTTSNGDIPKKSQSCPTCAIRAILALPFIRAAQEWLHPMLLPSQATFQGEMNKKEAPESHRSCSITSSGKWHPAALSGAGHGGTSRAQCNPHCRWEARLSPSSPCCTRCPDKGWGEPGANPRSQF